MPNFSHGTAGVGYFLARLYKETGRKVFLDGAMAAAQELVSLENKDAWVPHHDNEEGKNLYYLSWCHGPAGTARFYYELFRITGDPAWKDRIRKAAQAMMSCGIPEKRLPGYWNNVSVCCGTAGIASFYLDMHQLLGEKQYLEFAYVMTKDLLTSATTEGDGQKWTQAEHRRRPELLQAQTGLMQGAAGVGLWMLRLDAFERKAKRVVRLPDDPF
jgi:lantibiotic modifying enzyme